MLDEMKCQNAFNFIKYKIILRLLMGDGGNGGNGVDLGEAVQQQDEWMDALSLALSNKPSLAHLS